jgi:hypothetical protein
VSCHRSQEWNRNPRKAGSRQAQAVEIRMAEAPELPHIYVVTCIDDQTCGRAEAEPRGGCKKRIENYGAHKAYQAETAREGSPVFIKKLCAGPMVSEDGKVSE